MARQTIEVASCDLCGETRIEQEMHMDNAWTWNGRRYRFDADPNCYASIGAISINDLLAASHPDSIREHAARKQSARQPPKKVTITSSGSFSSRPREAGDDGKQRRFDLEEYAKVYRRKNVWHCPDCGFTSKSAEYKLLANHYWDKHGRRLWRDLQQRLDDQIVREMESDVAEEEPELEPEVQPRRAADVLSPFSS